MINDILRGIIAGHWTMIKFIATMCIVITLKSIWKLYCMEIKTPQWTSFDSLWQAGSSELLTLRIKKRWQYIGDIPAHFIKTFLISRQSLTLTLILRAKGYNKDFFKRQRRRKTSFKNILLNAWLISIFSFGSHTSNLYLSLGFSCSLTSPVRR